MRYMFVPLLAAVALLWPATAAADNYVTQSHKVLCAVTPDSTLPPGDHVVCQGRFAQAPQLGAAAVTDGDGAFRWEVGNLNVGNPTTTMAYGQTYHHGNWTINPDETGTRFTNDRTGHGMLVSIDNVYSF
jgi:hypothetical protein